MLVRTAAALLLAASATGVYAQSPYRVRDVHPGPASSDAGVLARAGSIAVFSASDPEHGQELWGSDGTREGTVLLADLVPGTDSSFPSSLTTVGGVVYFVARRLPGRVDLWKTDGTAAGTALVKDWAEPAPPASLVASGSTLFFRMATAAQGAELWKSDGTTAGTTVVTDIALGAPSSNPTGLRAYGGGIVFAALGAGIGVELWKSDGTAAGTTVVRDLNPGVGGSAPLPQAVLGGLAFFTANVPGTGVEPWVTDGTAAGTRLLSDLNPGPASSQPSGFAVSQGSIYFSATEPATGRELYRSDGTTVGTVRVVDLNPGPDSSSAGSPVAVGTSTLFAARPDGSDVELYRTDGTAGGTVRVKDINPGLGASEPFPLAVLSGVLYLSAFDDEHGLELWRSDGTEAGTALVADLNPGVADSDPLFALTIGDRLTFVATDGTSGFEPWAVDAGGPVVDAGPDQSVGVGVDALVEGSAVDPEGEPLTFEWLDASDAVLATGASAALALPPGAHVVTLLVSDGPHRGSDRLVVTVGERLRLTVIGNESGQGLIDTDLGDSCGSEGTDLPCDFYYPAGTHLTLTATATYDSTFLGWSGACSGTGTCQVTMDGPQAVEAIFLGPATLSLTLDGALGGGGAVLVEPPGETCSVEDGASAFCQHSFVRGTTVQLTPLPAPGSVFGGWGGAHCTGVGPCTLLMEEYPEVSASFVGQRSLRVDVGGTGGGQGAVSIAPPGASCAMTAPDASAQCSYFYAQDETVTLTPAAAAGSGFVGWTGACSGTGSCTVAVDGHEAVGAMFEGPRDLTVVVAGDGLGLGSVSIDPPGITCAGGPSTIPIGCVETYPHGTVVTLTPHPEPNSAFEGWAGEGCSGTGACTITLSAHRSVTARFVGPRPFRLEVWGEEGGQGTIVLTPGGATCAVPAPDAFVICDLWFLPGEVVTVTPVPAPGSRLAHWFGDCTGDGPCSVTVASSSYVRASFYGPPKLAVQLQLTGGASGTVAVDPPGATCAPPYCPFVFPFGTAVTLTPVAGPGSAFLGWADFGTCSGTGPCTVTMDASKFVSGTFGPAANQPPAVALSSPAAGTVHPQAPAGIALAASASDADGTVARVEFFANGAKVGESLLAPFGTTWAAPPGAYVLTARATDDDGAASDSAPVAIVVNAAPSLTVTSPPSDAAFVAPATVTLGADASDPDGTVVRVEFFEGAVSRGADTTSPYAVAWSNVPAGTHALTAVATDDRGATVTVPFTVVVSTRVAATADAYVRDGEPFQNFGDENRLHVRKAAGSNNNRWTYLRFGVGAPSSVSGARLRLYGNLAEETAMPVAAQAFPVANTTWNERTITWHNRPATGGSALAAAALDTATTEPRWYEWDLTAYVQAERAAGRSVISIAIRNDVVTTARAAFRSREANQNRPELLLAP
ncbi:MAG: ELWxxDGT repeat protein [Vicinamibacteria bacterium]